MSENNEIRNMNKCLSHYTIVWNFPNFCMAIKDSPCCVSSPSFSLKGDCLTKWRMYLNIETLPNKLVPLSFTLERLKDSGPEKVFANWEVTIQVGNLECKSIEKKCEFENGYKMHVMLPTLENVLNELEPFNGTLLSIQCTMIVRSYEPLDFNLKPPFSLKCLSNDLRNMMNMTKYKDVTVEVYGRKVTAHKIILSRSSVFKSMLLLNPPEEGNVLRLRGIEYEDMLKSIRFIYSGCINNILTKPSFSLYKFLPALGSDVLTYHYAPGKMFLYTKFPVEGCFFPWLVNNFSRLSEEFLSQKFQKEGQNRTWRLRLFPFYKLNDKDFICVSAEVLGGKEPLYCCLEFAIGDLNKNLHYRKRMLKTRRNGVNEFKYFVERDQLRHLIYNDTLVIIFGSSSLIDHRPSYDGVTLTPSTGNCPERTTYEELSSQMKDVFDRMEMWDLTILTGNESYRAHKCILSARSSRINQMLFLHTDELRLDNIEPFVFPKFLKFIYCGVLEDCDFIHLHRLYKLAATYGVKGLQEECIEYLKEIANDNNRAELLALVNALRHEKLYSVFLGAIQPS